MEAVRETWPVCSSYESIWRRMIQFHKKMEGVRKVDRKQNGRDLDEHMHMINVQQSDISAHALFFPQIIHKKRTTDNNNE